MPEPGECLNSPAAALARSPRRLELVGGTVGLMIIGLGAGIAVTGSKE